MISTKLISAERLKEFGLMKGDTLQVMEVEDSMIVLQVSRAEVSVPVKGAASAWLESARGSVKMDASETVDDVRMAYYKSRYGITS